MLIRLLRWFTGYLLVQIKGYSPERFINLCSSKNILIWNLRKTEKGYEFYISVKGFRKLRPIVKKTKTRPFILERRGLPFLLFRYRKKKVFFFGILLSAIMIYSFSLFIWNITISGEYSNTREMILKYLNSEQVHTGVLKRNIDCRYIEEAIRREYEDIGWVSAEVRGTRLIIKLKETNMPEMKNANTTPHHIAAAKDGIITSIITRKGVPKVRPGDVVKKGDILVSGIVEIIGDSGEILNYELTPSDADIRMKTFYNYKEEYPMKYTAKEYSGEIKKGYAISVLNEKINFYKPLKKFDKYDIIENEQNLRIGKDFYLPIIFSTKYYREYSEQTKTYTKEEITKAANDRLTLFQSKLMEKGVEVIENDVKIVIDGSKCIAQGRLIVEESPLKEQSIDDSEWRNTEINEHSGDDH